MTAHMPRNDVAASSHVWSGMRIHVIAVTEPPHRGTCPMADIGPCQAIVVAEQIRNSAAQAPKNQYRDTRSAFVISTLFTSIMAPPSVEAGCPVRRMTPVRC